MSLVLLGLSHETAPVAVRERYAVPEERWPSLGALLVRDPHLDEAAVLSTCNRTELLAAARDPDAALRRLRDVLDREIGDGSVLGHQLFALRGDEAVLHVFRTASGLGSMVLGEAQILGQVKTAYRASVEAGACGPLLSRVFHAAFRAAKRVRAETGLGSAPISVAGIGVKLARELFESLEGKRVLLLGAGEMAEQALRGLRGSGAHDVVVLNRSPETAEQLAERFGGRAGSLRDLGRELLGADLVLCSLASDKPVVGADDLTRALRDRPGRPVLVIDLGIPRNVDARANDVADAYLYDLDDLEAVALRSRGSRAAAVGPAERILDEECARFARWHAALGAAPAIQRLRAHFVRAVAAELARSAADLERGGVDSAAARQRAAEAIASKLLHAPLSKLREEAEEGGAAYYADAVRELFGLDGEEE